MKNLISSLNKSVILAMSLFFAVAMITSCSDDEGPTTPVEPDPSMVVASFTSQVDADNSLTYSFTNSSVVNGITDRSFTSSWDFGGDGTSNEESPTYTFSGEGSFDVTLTVTASDGETGTFTETIMVTAPKNRYASITDLSDSDTGELRVGVDSIQTGRITFMYRVTAGTGSIADGFIHVGGKSGTGDFALVEVRFKDDAPHQFREGASDETIAAAMFPEGAPDVWIPVEVSWAADQVNLPTYSLTIGGQTVITDAVSTTNGGSQDEEPHRAAVIDGAEFFGFKYNSNSSTNDGMMHVDDIVVYSSDSGTEVVVFEDNFQGRTAGDNLDPDVDETAPYRSETSEATVAEE